MANLPAIYHPSRALRSSTRSLLCIPSIKSNSFGGCAFYIKRAETVETLILTLGLRHFCFKNITVN